MTVANATTMAPQLLQTIVALCACALGAQVAHAVGGTLSSPSIVASPAVLEKSGDSVTLSWSGIPSPAYTDVISVTTVPAAGTPSVNSTIGWVNVSSIAGWDTGAGSVKLPLVNLRKTGYVFAYTTALSDESHTATTVFASSTVVRFQNATEPTGVRLSLGAEQGTLEVAWTSESAEAQAVRWAPSAQWPHGATTQASTVQRYAVTDMCGSPANSSTSWLEPGAMHHATIGVLDSGVEYMYQVGGTETGWSSPRAVVGPPRKGADQATSMLIFGDLGVDLPFNTFIEQQEPASKTVQWLIEEVRNDPSTLAMHTGDISYARGAAFSWDYFHAQVEPVASLIPWQVGVGNHEYDWPTQSFRPSWSNYGTDSGGECGVPYSRRFRTAGPDQPDGEANMWYSFDHGSIHVAVFSTEHDFSPSSPQFKWLEQDLASVDRSVTPWLLVTGHRPMYSSSAGNCVGTDRDAGKQDSYMRLWLEPLLVKYEVSMALYGHVHKYERTCGMVNFTCAASDNDAPVHIVMGNAGNVYQVPWEPYNPKSGASLQNAGHTQQPEWSMFRTADFGYTRVHTVPAGSGDSPNSKASLTLELVGDMRGQVHDSVTLYRD